MCTAYAFYATVVHHSWDERCVRECDAWRNNDQDCIPDVLRRFVIKKKGVKFNALPKRINANVLPKRINARGDISVGPDDPSVMSEEAISEEHKVPTEPSNNEPPETVGAEVAEETTLTPENIFQIELAKGPESFCKISKNLNYRAFERMITSFLFADAHIVSIVASSMQRRLCMYEADLFRKYLPGLGHPLNDIFSIQNIE